MTKAQLELRCEILGNLLFEAIYLISMPDTEDDYELERYEESIQDFLSRARLEGFA